MQQSELYRLCGIQITPPPLLPKWAPAQLKFIGADDYVLGTKHVDVRIEPGQQGICLTTKGKLSLNASALLGNKIQKGKLFDVLVVTESVTMSLAKLCPGMYPLVLRTNERVELN